MLHEKEVGCEKMKENLFGIIYGIILITFTVYMAFDTFLIGEVYTVVSDNTAQTQTNTLDAGKVISTDMNYEDDNIKISIVQYNEYDTVIYVADVQIKDVSVLKTAFANNSYGKNITAKTSSIAESVNAILAINGDYYGVQEKGYVLKNGVVYRDKAKSNQEDLVIYEDGSFEIINESSVDIYTLQKNGAYNILAFGPALVKNGKVSVTTNQEVGKAMASNPRTAIGIIDDLHYIFVVSDGRTNESEGLSLYELATFMKEKLNVKTAYNLDGGGSSTMYFNGNVINNPTTNGNRISERSVSDIVYIGY